MPTRRAFLGAISLPAVGLGDGILGFMPSAANGAALATAPGSPETIARDEDFWFEVSRAFTLDRSTINFNNGGVSECH